MKFKMEKNSKVTMTAKKLVSLIRSRGETSDLLDFNKERALTLCENADIVAIDTETTGLGVKDGRDHILGISIATWDSKEETSTAAAYFPFYHGVPSNIVDPDNLGYDVLNRLRKLIGRDDKLFVFHNAKFDIFSLRTTGIRVGENFVDTTLIAHLINENWPVLKSLDNCTKQYLGYAGKEKPHELKVISERIGWHAVPAFLMDHYAEVDAEITLKLYQALMKKVDFG